MTFSQSLLEGLPDAVVIVKKDGTIVFVNTCTEKICGYQRDELLGKSVEILIPDRFRNVHVKHRAAYGAEPLTRPMGVGLEVVARRKDGSEFPVEVTLSPIETGDGIFITSVVRDITRRKRMEEALRENEQRYRDLARELEQQLIVSDRLVSLGELAASIAHEFNNPLQIIMGFTEDLLTEEDPSDPHYEALKIIEKEARRCKEVVRDLLDFARPAGVDLKLVNIKDILRKSFDLLLVHLEKAKVESEIEIQPDLPQIYADPQQMEQVLINLLFNAVEAMPGGGTLTVRVTARRSRPGYSQGDDLAALNEVIIALSDTGVGIEPDVLPNIFRPFFTTKKKRGMGLGLSICERIMRAHGGRLEVESRPGQGTTFYLHLPLKSRP